MFSENIFGSKAIFFHATASSLVFCNLHPYMLKKTLYFASPDHSGFTFVVFFIYSFNKS
jgi:hypothetical protein